jgi:hypothetical protein
MVGIDLLFLNILRSLATRVLEESTGQLQSLFGGVYLFLFAFYKHSRISYVLSTTTRFYLSFSYVYYEQHTYSCKRERKKGHDDGKRERENWFEGKNSMKPAYCLLCNFCV